VRPRFRYLPLLAEVTALLGLLITALKIGSMRPWLRALKLINLDYAIERVR
jgi:hypothetical protein